ncbi:LPS export ABC transporter periplasmic protein LptC [Lacisediminimonas profundi]|uniref:LPS export ABC transporter periplasmic protein LptC n=1 Tax=Lacisediminimonas profundi TaxID=2603856 RepID=UPI00124B1CC5|nr:LPS export ABC transporter periplasmic protein LptC [Lacisediminimonas profundi]
MTTATHSISRFGMVTLLVLTTVLVLVSFWVLEVMRRSAEDSGPQAKRIDPDYFVETFTFLRLSQAGGARYSISGKRLEHNPVDDTHHIQLPEVNSFSDERPPVKSTAQRGIVTADNSKVHLYDDVHVDRPASGQSRHFHLNSDYLLVLVDEDIVRTDKPVEITLGKSVLRGTGMVANNATRQLQLGNAVQATFASPERSR